MDIKEIQQKKEKLEIKIHELINEFKKETNIDALVIYHKDEIYRSPIKDYVVSSSIKIDIVL